VLAVDGYVTELGATVLPACALETGEAVERLTRWPQAMDFYDNAGHVLHCGAGEPLPPEVTCLRDPARVDANHSGVTCMLATSRFAEVSLPVFPACYAAFSRLEPCEAPTPAITCLSPSRLYLGGVGFTSGLAVHPADAYIATRLADAQELEVWPASPYGARLPICDAGTPLP